MQLVYLYVEDYKNIKKEGFNFSSQFYCIYDYTNQKLRINERKDFENIFARGINITAIVGENGSGKSRLLEIISLFRFEKLGNNNKRFLLVFFGNGQFYVLTNKMHNYDNFETLPSKLIQNETSFSINASGNIANLFYLSFFSNGLSDFTDKNDLLRSIHYDSFYNGGGSDVPFERKFIKPLLDIQDFYSFMRKDFIFMHMRLEMSIEPIKIQVDDKKLGNIIEHFNNCFSENIDTSVIVLGKLEKRIDAELCIYNFFTSYFLDKYFRLVGRYIDELEPSMRSEFWEVFAASVPIKSDNPSIEMLDGILSYLKKIYLLLKKSIESAFEDRIEQKNDFEKNSSCMESIQRYDKIIKLFLKQMQLDLQSRQFISQTQKISNKNLENIFKIVNFDPVTIELYKLRLLNIDFLSNSSDFKFSDLSTGEKQLINFIVNLLYSLIQSNEKRILLLDEIEIGFHPRWQKEIVFIVIECIESLRRYKLIDVHSYHLIFCTHSPFILSDLPRENLVFLKNGKQIGAFEKKQTFGANIHTLLADSFFMNDGLIGEFAKSRINDVIKFLNNEANETIKSANQAQRIINLIGEPILKMQLQRMLSLKKQSKIESLEKAVESLDERVKKLEDASD